MSRDLIIGILLSAAIHLGVLFGDKINPAWFKPAPKKVEAEPEKIQLIAMPKLDEPEPEIIEVTEDVKPLDLAPPMQQDVPQLVTPESFVQKIQPPPPEGITISASMNIVPEVRDPNMFKGMKVFDISMRSEEHTSELQSPCNLVCRLLLEKKNKKN